MSNSQSHLFLKRLVTSKLLDERQLRRARRIVQSELVPEKAAVGLVERGLLTRWQARQLLTGAKTKFFLGKYKLLKLVGTGAMGSVFKAFHPTMNRVVALKVMARDILSDQRAIARFQREIRAAAMLDHPHIVRALDADHARNQYFLVMEYIDGKDLRHWIKASAPLPIAWSCECLRQAAEGLQHAHARGIVHRDLKPSNLLLCGKSLTTQPLIKLADFGLAQVADDYANDMKLTRVGRTVGSFFYMAPEQARDATADIRSDIFSLGCTLFQMISGKLPFQGKSEVEILKMRLTQDAPALSQFRRDVDPNLDQLVARMLARDPAQRFQTPAELAEALAPFAQGHQTTLSQFEHRTGPWAETPTNAGTFDTTDSSFDTFLQSFPEAVQRRSALDQTQAGGWKLQLALWLSLIAAIGLLMGMVCQGW